MNSELLHPKFRQNKTRKTLKVFFELRSTFSKTVKNGPILKIFGAKQVRIQPGVQISPF